MDYKLCSRLFLRKYPIILYSFHETGFEIFVFVLNQKKRVKFTLISNKKQIKYALLGITSFFKSVKNTVMELEKET